MKISVPAVDFVTLRLPANSTYSASFPAQWIRSMDYPVGRSAVFISFFFPLQSALPQDILHILFKCRSIMWSRPKACTDVGRSISIVCLEFVCRTCREMIDAFVFDGLYRNGSDVVCLNNGVRSVRFSRFPVCLQTEPMTFVAHISTLRSWSSSQNSFNTLLFLVK